MKSNDANLFQKLSLSKGQFISKCLFWCLHFLPKNKSTSSKVECVCSFFGINVGLKKSFRICLTFSNCQSKPSAARIIQEFQSNQRGQIVPLTIVHPALDSFLCP